MQYCRVIGKSGWKQPRRSLVQPPIPAGSAMGSDHAAQGLIQLGLVNFEGLRMHSFSGQPAPLLDCPPNEDISLHIQP